MTFVIILVVSLALVPVFALMVHRRVDVGEARFDKDGRLKADEPKADGEAWRVDIRRED